MVVHEEHGYELSVYKNPKVGRKAVQVVPILTNCLAGPPLMHRRGSRLPSIIANYCKFSLGVDPFNQMCLQHQEEHRFQSWWKALRGMMLRIPATNALTSCNKGTAMPAG